MGHPHKTEPCRVNPVPSLTLSLPTIPASSWKRSVYGSGNRDSPANRAAAHHHAERFARRWGYWRSVVADVVDKFLACGIMKRSTFGVEVTSAGQADSASLAITINAASETNEIAIGGTVTGLSGSQSFDLWTVSIPSGTSQLLVRLSGGTGDADLYIGEGSGVSRSYTGYDCRSYTWSSNNEVCLIEYPAPGTWTIGIDAASSYSGVTLDVNPAS